MADFVFDKFKEALGGFAPVSATVSLLWHSSISGTSDIEAALVIGDMADVGSIKAAVDVTAALADGSINEYAGTNYARKAVTGRTIATSTYVTTFSAATIPTWSALGPNTAGSAADCDGVLLMWIVPGGSDNDGNNVPLMYFDLKNASTSLSFTGSNGDVTITHASGMVTLT
jgi:hypothetical protein